MKFRLRKILVFSFVLLLFSTILNLTPSLISVNAALTTQLTDNAARDENPRISADGSKIAFCSDVDGDFEIFVVNFDGSGLTQLTSNNAADMYPVISADGSKIAFKSDVDGDFEIFVVNFDGSGLTQLTSNIVDEGEPCISGDGSKIVFNSPIDGDQEIFVVNSDGTGPPTQLTTNTNDDENPVISGDGSKIAYQSWISGSSNYEICVMNSDGSGQTQITMHLNDCWRPMISGDGSKITYTVSQGPAPWNYDCYAINSDGSGLIQLAPDTGNEISTSISDDVSVLHGSKITLLIDVDGDFEIFVVYSDGSGLTQRTFNTATDWVPSISGDGSKIAFQSDIDGDNEIFVIAEDVATAISIGTNPSIVTVGQPFVVSGEVFPGPPSGYVYSGLTINVQTPIGTTETFGPFETGGYSGGYKAIWYTPTMLGTYHFWVHMPDNILGNVVYLESTSAIADVIVQDYIPTTSSLSVTPNPTTVGYPLQIEGQVLPAPPEGYFYDGITFTVELPTGATETLGPIGTDAAGQCSIGYAPYLVGTYGFYMNTPEQTLGSNGYLASTSPTVDVPVWESFPLSVNVDPPAGGSVSRTPGETGYAYGTEVTLTPTANSGYTFSGWSGPGEAGSGDDWVVTVTSPNMEVTAFFSEIPYGLTVNISPEGSGFVSVEPDPFGYGQEVLLYAYPYGGWYFDYWSGDLTGSANPQTLVVDGVKTVTAHFLDVPDLTVTWVGAGSVSVDPAGPYTIGQEVTLTADPAAGWVFDYWTDDLTGDTNPATIVMDGDKTVTAVFLDTPDLTVNTVGGGSVDVYPVAPYYYGDVVELTAVADLLWAFDHWEGDLLGSDNPASITMDGDKIVTAYFAAVPQGLTIESKVYSTSLLTQGWRYLIKDDLGTLLYDFTLDANAGGTMTFTDEPFLSGGVYTITAIPKFGYTTDMEAQPDGSSSAIISEEPGVYEVIVELAAGGGTVITFNNAELALTVAPVTDPPVADFEYDIPEFTIVPIQAAWEADKNGDGTIDLVAGKATAVLVSVPGFAGADLTLQELDPDGSVIGTLATATVAANERATFYLTLDNEAYGVLARDVVLGVSGVPGISPLTVSVRDTRDLSLYYGVLKSNKYSAPSGTDYDEFVATCTDFIGAVYPVKYVDASTSYAEVKGQSNMLKDCIAVAAQALANGYEVGVAVAGQDYFAYRGYPDGAGVSYGPNFKGVIVANDYPTTAAHEVAHTYWVYWGVPEDYQLNPKYGAWSSGVSIVDGQWRTGYNFMGVAVYDTTEKTWVNSEGTYNELFNQLAEPGVDPEIIIVSGIFSDGGLTFEKPIDWIRVSEGMASDITPGDYAIRFVDENGDQIGDDIDFDVQYFASINQAVQVGIDAPSIEGLGTIPIDEAGFVFAVPVPEQGFAAIQVIDNTNPTAPVVIEEVASSEIVNADIATDGYFTDSDYNPIQTFECVFTPNKDTYKMSATNPGTFVYNLKVTNNNDPATEFEIVVNIPPQFVLKPLSPGANPVKIDDEPVDFFYDAATGTLTVSGVQIVQGETKTLSLHVDYALKYKYNPVETFTEADQTSFFRSYAFSATVNSFAAEAPTIFAVGKKAAAIGGFLLDVNNVPKGGLTVTVTDSNGEVGSCVSTSDGFYFIVVPPGGPYMVQITSSLEDPVGPVTILSIGKDQFVERNFNNLSPADPTIKGLVKDDALNGVSGVTVQLLNKKGKVLATTTTNLGGYYIFTFYQPGEYTVQIEVPPEYTATSTSTTLKIKQFETAKINFNLSPQI